MNADNDKIEYIRIGYVTKPHGVNGEVKVAVLSDDPERFEKMNTVMIGTEIVKEEFTILSVKYFKGDAILKFKNVDSVEDAEKIRGKYLLIEEKDALKLPEGSYYIFELIGCSVYDVGGTFLGKIVEVLATGSNDVYLVKKAGEEGQILIPALKNVVRSVSVAEKKIVVELPEGLDEL
jgi:16S rRNA processing protein RimM